MSSDMQRKLSAIYAAVDPQGYDACRLRGEPFGGDDSWASSFAPIRKPKTRDAATDEGGDTSESAQ